MSSLSILGLRIKTGPVCTIDRRVHFKQYLTTAPWKDTHASAPACMHSSPWPAPSERDLGKTGPELAPGGGLIPTEGASVNHNCVAFFYNEHVLLWNEGRMDISSILILLIHEHGMFFHLFVSLSISFINVF